VGGQGEHLDQSSSVRWQNGSILPETLQMRRVRATMRKYIPVYPRRGRALGIKKVVMRTLQSMEKQKGNSQKSRKQGRSSTLALQGWSNRMVSGPGECKQPQRQQQTSRSSCRRFKSSMRIWSESDSSDLHMMLCYC
jgi:hypothetical protein